MKKALLLIMLLFSFASYAQNNIEKLSDAQIEDEFSKMKENFTESPNEWIFSKVITVDGHNKEEIFTVFMEVLASYYKDVKDIIQNADKEQGVILAKGAVKSPTKTFSSWVISAYQVPQIIKVDIKDNRYKITITVDGIKYQYGPTLDLTFANCRTYQLSSFFPYARNSKAKFHCIEFDALKYAYDSSWGSIDAFATELNKKLSNNEDW